MQSLSFIANIAVIAGVVVSLITLIIVLADYYKSHLKTARSRIVAVPRTGNNRITGNANRFTIRLKVGFNNEGKRDGFVIPKDVKYIKLRDDIGNKVSTFADLDPKDFDLEKVGESRVPPSSNVTGYLTLGFSDNVDLGKSFTDTSKIVVQVSFLVEDNEGSYTIEYSDTIDTTPISW
ncbi:hypothetical protein EGO51_13250 [Haloarcula hispanica]|uniref:Uncharacterized protein n=1 Tax=Haloarcula hispanica TaxID=51589 RepID=A0A5J5LM78_HALHI|nr:hypothetical protein [Haloarcula hispanica]KAA9410726.1 hypothetical protein EGO51_13250 [Haloarcula hispanica]